MTEARVLFWIQRTLAIGLLAVLFAIGASDRDILPGDLDGIFGMLIGFCLALLLGGWRGLLLCSLLFGFLAVLWLYRDITHDRLQIYALGFGSACILFGIAARVSRRTGQS